MAILFANGGLDVKKDRIIPKEHRMDMSTDTAWEEWGRRDPYFGVITDPKFRRSGLNELAKQHFFQLGGSHTHYVLDTIRSHIQPGFAPQRVLDFGCGVGRLVVPFAKIAGEVVGLDVSPSMLQEARRNCDEYRLDNVQLLPSDDALSALTGSFDLIHSSIVFQHIPVERGRTIFAKLLQHLRPQGVAAVQLTYSKTCFASTHGVAPPSVRSLSSEALSTPINADPVMQMNSYNMNEILFFMQSRGVQRFHTEFTDHGGELGLFMFFQV
jgi:2-polyprenyl-3-methyl-5-hydroxy-6-metoxy-1,4-benzoquinol methylase